MTQKQNQYLSKTSPPKNPSSVKLNFLLVAQPRRRKAQAQRNQISPATNLHSRKHKDHESQKREPQIKTPAHKTASNQQLSRSSDTKTKAESSQNEPPPTKSITHIATDKWVKFAREKEIYLRRNEKQVRSQPNNRKIARKSLLATQRQSHVYTLTCKNLNVRSSLKNPLRSQERRGREEEVLVTTKSSMMSCNTVR